jgi:mRNA interferase MazF
MPISFAPDRGQIVMCDFSSGFIRPEMQKVRHCIVISPNRRTGTCVIVPLSTAAPNPPQAYHYKIPRHVYPCLECGVDVWAKGDMVTHASFGRLDRPKENGMYASRKLNDADLEGVVHAALAAVECSYLVKHRDTIDAIRKLVKV